MKNPATDPLDCPNCKIPVPAYTIANAGHRVCGKCECRFGVFESHNLVFILKFGQDAANLHKSSGRAWRIERAFQDTNWQDFYKKLSTPKIVVHWSFMRGMTISKLGFTKEVSLESLPWESLEPHINSYDIMQPIHLWLQEYYAGFRQPDDA